jgi:flavin-dependent dehydrogenase
VFDVVIAGGGPAGSVCAATLAQKGLQVLVLEKTKFPRFHLGESLLPNSLPVLEAIGALPEIESRFIWKHGARFHEDHGPKRRKDRFDFANAWRGELDHAFEVPRDEFDQLLLEHARKLGADVREEETVVRLERGRVVTKQGEAFEARFVVDATGRDAVTAHAARATTKIEGLDQSALFGHFTGVPRADGKLAGDIDIVLFPDPDEARPNWFWFIPFEDGRTSVGAVVSRAWIKERRGSVSEMFAAAVSASPTATEMLAGANLIWPEHQATADFSYRVGSFASDGLLRIGDAGGFIDPLFSTGAHLARVGGHRAGNAIAGALADPARERELLAGWETTLRTGAETFISAVQAFYEGPLVEVLFHEDKHEALRRSVTSLLAGDVFGDSVWLRDAKKRIAAMLSDG